MPVMYSLTPQEVQKRMVVLLFVVFTFDLVEAKLDVGYFACNGDHRCKRPASEVAHRLCGIDLLGSGGLPDGERVITYCDALSVYVGDLSLARAAAVL